MKKTVKLFGLLTIAAALLVSCSNNATPTSDTGFGGNTDKFSYSVDFTKATVEDAYCINGAPVVADKDSPVTADDGSIVVGATEDGALQIAGYSWDSYKIHFDTVDLSKATKVTITAKCGDPYTKPDAFLFEIASGTKATGMTTWADSNFMVLTTEYKDFTVNLSSFQGLDSNSKYSSSVLETFTAVDGLGINPRGASGEIFIKSIVFEQ